MVPPYPFVHEFIPHVPVLRYAFPPNNPILHLIFDPHPKIITSTNRTPHFI